MFARFMKITNEFQALEKMYTKVEKVIKILRFLPNKYEAKMMIVQEAKDVTKIPLEALIGSCMIHKINMNNHQ